MHVPNGQIVFRVMLWLGIFTLFLKALFESSLRLFKHFLI
jgi:hypothetical protein